MNSLFDSFILFQYQLSFNPLTTHGVQHIVQALTTKRNAVTVLDLSVSMMIDR